MASDNMRSLLSIKRAFRIVLLSVYFYIFIAVENTYGLKLDDNFEGAFEVVPWQVGQFVEYQIISIEDEGRKNRYRISLIGQEEIRGKIYFWKKIDIYEYAQYRFQKEGKLTKNITFLALVSPVTTWEFSKRPEYYIANGFYPYNAVKLKVQILDGAFIDVDPKSYFSYQEVIEETSYAITPDAMGKVDFSRMQIEKPIKEISVPAGNFKCYHIFVNTDIKKEYWDEGFDLWRSSEVPLLGIVRMEFSKTLYWGKWSYRNECKEINNIKDFFEYLYRKRVPGRRRADTYIVNLINYGRDSK